MIGIDDVDSIRNGLLLFKPLAWAFDTSRLYLDEDEMGNLCMRLLDRTLANKDLVECWQDLETQRLSKEREKGIQV